MIYTVYADVLFVLNFIIDFICLCISLYVCRLKRKPLLVFASSALGGGYAIASLYLVGKWGIFIHIAILVLMGIIATPTFNLKDVLRLCGVYFWVSAILGGVVTAILSNLGTYVKQAGVLYADVSPLLLIAIVILTSFMLLPFLLKARNRLTARTVLVKITRKRCQKTFDALVDSGNLLSDPVSADGIILVKANELEGMFDENQLCAIKKLDVLSESFPTGIRLISTDRGLIPIFRPEETEIKIFNTKGRRLVNALIGIDFTEGSFAGAGGLLPSSLI